MKQILFFAILLLSQCAGAQTITADKVSWAEGVFEGTDALGNEYAVRDNTFTKMAELGTIDFRDLSLGRIARTDLQNPLSIMLFYEHFNTVLLLDNQLNEIRRIRFSELRAGVVATAAGTAARNRLWVFDSLTQRLGFFDYANNQFVPLTQVLTDGIQAYSSDFNYFYWIDGKGKYWVCDQFGKITQQASVGAYDAIQILGPTLYMYSKDGGLFVYDIKKDQQYRIENVEKSFSGFRYKDQILSIFTDGSITNYKITIP